MHGKHVSMKRILVIYHLALACSVHSSSIVSVVYRQQAPPKTICQGVIATVKHVLSTKLPLLHYSQDAIVVLPTPPNMMAVTEKDILAQGSNISRIQIAFDVDLAMIELSSDIVFTYPRNPGMIPSMANFSDYMSKLCYHTFNKRTVVAENFDVTTSLEIAVCLIPQRYVLAILCSLASALVYSLRYTLFMPELLINANTRSANTTCCGPRIKEARNKYGPKPARLENVWSIGQQGFIIGAYYYGYALGNIPAGFLSEWYGLKHICGTGILIASLMVMATPLLLQATDYSWIMFFFLRAFEGVGSGTCYSCIIAFLARWVPPKERNFMVCLTMNGCSIGTATITLARDYLIEAAKDWSVVYYVFGGLGVIWYCVWLLLVTSYPDDNPYISQKEKNEISKALKGLMLPATCLVIVGYTACYMSVMLALIFLGIGFLGVYRCGVPLTMLEISSNFAPSIMGIINGSGCFTGILAQLLQGSFVDLGTLDQWRLYFWILFVIFLTSSIVYITTVTTKQEWWNDISEVNRRKQFDHHHRSQSSL